MSVAKEGEAVAGTRTVLAKPEPRSVGVIVGNKQRLFGSTGLLEPVTTSGGCRWSDDELMEATGHSRVRWCPGGSEVTGWGISA